MIQRRMSRRNVLKTAGVVWTTSLFTGRLRGANDRPTGGFIGVGTMGSENLKVALEQGVEVKAVCDVYQPHLERAGAMVARRGQKAKEIRDFREILADPSIDFVCLSTPDHWHAYMSIEACKAGKDVYVEKPVCLTIDEGLKMVEAARKYDRVVQAGTWQRSGQHFQRACEMVRSGQLGQVTFAHTWIYSNETQKGIGNPPDCAVPEGLDWDLWLGPSPERAFNPNRFGVYPNSYSYFRWFWDYAGGHLTDSGVHMIDILQMAFDEAMPKAATALGGKLWFQDNRETPDTLQVTYEYPGFVGSWEHRCNNFDRTLSRPMGVTFHGTRGTLYVDRSLYKVYPERGSDLQAGEMKRVSDPHPLHWTNFLECLKTRRQPNSDLEKCFRSSVTCLLGNMAYRNQSRVDWDDERKTVLQPHLQQALSREYRQPWKLEV
ncbi:MAG: Gfo/Idh/MocA family oxidoreductase [Acidobacteriota bacterium]